MWFGCWCGVVDDLCGDFHINSSLAKEVCPAKAKNIEDTCFTYDAQGAMNGVNWR